MSGNSLGWIILAFALYLLMMVVIGALYAKKNSSTEDYFLGGRSLGGFVAALSAQASDMSGWLLMGLPGSIYALGTGPGGVVDGKEVKMEVKVGDNVIYSKYSGTEVKIEDEEYIIVKQNDILAVIQ